MITLYGDHLPNATALMAVGDEGIGLSFDQKRRVDQHANFDRRHRAEVTKYLIMDEGCCFPGCPAADMLSLTHRRTQSLTSNSSIAASMMSRSFCEYAHK